MRLSVCLGVAALLAGSCADELSSASASVVEPVDNNLLDLESTNKNVQEQCSSKHPMSCLKLTLIRGLDRLSRWPSSMELAPGFTVKGDLSTLQELPRDVRSGQLDEALLRSLTRYLSSLSLTVRVMDGGTVRKMQEVGEKLAEAPEDSSAGGAVSRGRKPGGPLLMAGMMSGGTLLALGLAAIAAMAGKAMMAALLSLMMSAMAAMRGGGGGGGDKSSYEVIHAHDHKHRSLDSTGAGDTSYAYPDYALPPAMRRGFITPVNTRR